jgi:hypothetical protein
MVMFQDLPLGTGKECEKSDNGEGCFMTVVGVEWILDPRSAKYETRVLGTEP